MNESLQFRTVMAVLMVTLWILILIPITDAAVTSSDSVTITGYILPHTAPDANFTATPISGTAPLTVQFTDFSTGSPASWAWDFEHDGIIDSTEQSPPHIYTVAGIYSVSLTVTNLQGSDTLVRTGYITVAPQDPLTRIRALETYVKGLSILEWSKWLLNSPLTNAEKQLEKGNERPAINQMRSFIDNVRLLRWFGFISQGQADYMITEANAIIGLIEA